MKSFAISLLLLASSTLLQAAINQSCKAEGEPASYIRVHGRLMVYNGGYPNLRLWQIGTHHLFGIFSDMSDLRCARGGACNGDEDTRLPGNLQHMNLLDSAVYGDFEIRVLEPFKAGHMQAACIVDAQRVVSGSSN
jgi:hypothetical protein